MDVLPMAAIAAHRAMKAEAAGALPDAPIMRDPPRVRGPRLQTARRGLAGLLERAAKAIAPPPSEAHS